MSELKNCQFCITDFKYLKHLTAYQCRKPFLFVTSTLSADQSRMTLSTIAGETLDQGLQCNCHFRCGMSSLQKFDGEDLNNKARTKFQNEQQRVWAEQQMREKKAADDAKKRTDRLYELKMKELDQRAMELAQAEEECRRAINSATTDYNRAQVKRLCTGVLVSEIIEGNCGSQCLRSCKAY